MSPLLMNWWSRKAKTGNPVVGLRRRRSRPCSWAADRRRAAVGVDAGRARRAARRRRRHRRSAAGAARTRRLVLGRRRRTSTRSTTTAGRRRTSSKSSAARRRLAPGPRALATNAGSVDVVGPAWPAAASRRSRSPGAPRRRTAATRPRRPRPAGRRSVPSVDSVADVPTHRSSVDLARLAERGGRAARRRRPGGPVGVQLVEHEERAGRRAAPTSRRSSVAGEDQLEHHVVGEQDVGRVLQDLLPAPRRPPGRCSGRNVTGGRAPTEPWREELLELLAWLLASAFIG